MDEALLDSDDFLTEPAVLRNGPKAQNGKVSSPDLWDAALRDLPEPDGEASAGLTADRIFKVKAVAIGFAHSLRRPQYADDLAQEVFASWTRQGCTSQTIRQALIDAARKLFGDPRTASSFFRFASEHLYEEMGAVQYKAAKFVPLDDRLDCDRILEKLGRQDRLLLLLTYKWEFTLGEIAEMFDLTEARICQLIKRALERAKVESK